MDVDGMRKYLEGGIGFTLPVNAAKKLMAAHDAALARVEALERQIAQRDLDDAVSAAALEMLDRFGLDPNGTELSELEAAKEPKS